MSGDPRGRLTRREALLAAALGGFTALASSPRGALARGRTPGGGRLALRLPWSLASLDPHRIDDPSAALLGAALFESLYTEREGGALEPTLAEAEPEPTRGGLRVLFRRDLRTGLGRRLTARDAAASIARARSSGARAWLADVSTPRVVGDALVFDTRSASRLMRALASPLVAIVPAGFSPEAPDGTGPFTLARRDGVTALVPNPRAASGPPFLEDVTIRTASSLKDSLLAFESGTDDLGWLGDGLHEPRPGSKRFDLGAVGWAVLATGREAGAWDSPGIAQRLADEIPHRALAHLRVGAAWESAPERGWGGPRASLLVRDDSAWMRELAEVVAARLSRPDHEIGVRPVPQSELRQRRSSRLFGLALDVVRPLAVGGDALGALGALATADDATKAAALIKHPPQLGRLRSGASAGPPGPGDVSVRALTRTLRLGVVGELRVQGGHVPAVHLAPAPSGLGIDLGTTWREPKP